MICSLDEFRLLLKKWENESIQVAILSIMRTPSEVLCTSVVEGKIKRLNDNSFTVADDGDSLARVTFENCQFKYEDAENLFDANQGKRYENCVVLLLMTEDGHSSVSVMSVKQKTT
jgi:hypothetical protein